MYNDTNKFQKGFFGFGKNLFRKRTKRLLNDTEKEFQRYLNIFSLYFILFILVGIIFTVFDFSMWVISISFTVLFFLRFLLHFFFFLQRRKFSYFRFSVFFAFLEFVFAILFLAFQDGTNPVLFFGISLLGALLERILDLFYLIRIHDKSVLVMFVSILLNLLVGILVIVNPFDRLLYTEVLGIFAILSNILYLMEFSLLQKRITEIVDSFD